MSDEYEQHRGEDASYENEQSTVTITLKEYDKLKADNPILRTRVLYPLLTR